MNQEQRTRAIGRLKAGTIDLLVATDVAARGLDVDVLTHVVNYDVPAAPEAYVHRIGRVGRAGREGIAITLAQPREHRMLKAIERVTRQPIAVEKLPTVADLHARRLEATREALAAILAEGGEALDQFRVVVETLGDEHDLMEVALAAVKLARAAGGGEGEEHRDPGGLGAAGERAGGAERRDAPVARRGAARALRSAPTPERRGKRGGRGGTSARREQDARTAGQTRLFIGAGRERGIRPQDLVGAIANEAGLSGRQIGSIEIAERFSLVEVPEAAADTSWPRWASGRSRGARRRSAGRASAPSWPVALPERTRGAAAR